MARRGVGSVPRVEFRAGAHGDLRDRCAEPCCLGGRSNDTILRSGPAGANDEVPRKAVVGLVPCRYFIELMRMLALPQGWRLGGVVGEHGHHG